ncbi:AsnC family transcriptional regulator [Anderseniella sp. Alg231-50]|uniref:AsnC family transcriptional regulator n=1 Tax=Anderseniella sp. Alg231-50 TaxID=1922226 RepID=UPI000D56064E
MIENTNTVQHKASSTAGLDTFDRKILGALVADSGCSYARLGEIVGLSAPAVHERVKRLRKSGVILQSTVRLDGPAIGKPLLTFVHVEFEGWGKSKRLMQIAEFPEVEEMHSVAGDSGMIIKVRTADAHALELLLSQLYQLAGVRTTRSYITLSTFLERPVQAAVTDEWPDLSMPDE